MRRGASDTDEEDVSNPTTILFSQVEEKFIASSCGLSQRRARLGRDAQILIDIDTMGMEMELRNISSNLRFARKTAGSCIAGVLRTDETKSSRYRVPSCLLLFDNTSLRIWLFAFATLDISGSISWSQPARGVNTPAYDGFARSYLERTIAEEC